MSLAGKLALSRQFHAMGASRTHSWKWTEESFKPAFEWLMAKPGRVRLGDYLRASESKEVWRVSLPQKYGGYPIIYKEFPGLMHPYQGLLQHSLPAREAANFATLKTLGFSISDVLACGEQRHSGVLDKAFIITRCVEDAADGALLTSAGEWADKTRLRFNFCRVCLEQLAVAHRCFFFHRALYAHNLMIQNSSIEKNDEAPALIWINAAHCTFLPFISLRHAIAADLVTIFIDLRMQALEIKELCEIYLACNPTTGFTVDTLWAELCTFGRR